MRFFSFKKIGSFVGNFGVAAVKAAPLIKGVGYFISNLGVAVSAATAKAHPLVSVVSSGMSMFGNTFNFAAEDLETLTTDIFPGKSLLDKLLERQLGQNGITTEDYGDDLSWSSDLKQADALFKKKISSLYATVGGVLGVIGAISYLAVNAYEDTSVEKKGDVAGSLSAGICLGLQCFVHYFAVRHLFSVRRETAIFRNALAALAENEQFLSWKLDVLQRNSVTIHGRLAELVAEKHTLTETLTSHQAELQQKEEALSRLAEEDDGIRIKLQKMAGDLQTKTEQLSLTNSTISVEERAQQDELQSEIAALKNEQKHKESALKDSEISQQSINKECTKLGQTITGDAMAARDKDIEIAAIGQQCIKLDRRIDSLQYDLNPENHAENLHGTPN